MDGVERLALLKVSTTESKQDQLKRAARRAFLKEEHVREGEQRIVEEERRLTAIAAKTERLRALRQAKDTAEREAEPLPSRSKRSEQRR
jgi:hypothetical protein